jgi:hypothetical protein
VSSAVKEILPIFYEHPHQNGNLVWIEILDQLTICNKLDWDHMDQDSYCANHLTGD